MYNRIGLVDLGNNHILNFGLSGLEETKQNLQMSGVDYFGNPINESNQVVVENIDGQNIAFISYNYAGGVDVNQTLRAIKRAKEKNI